MFKDKEGYIRLLGEIKKIKGVPPPNEENVLLEWTNLQLTKSNYEGPAVTFEDIATVSIILINFNF